MQNAVVQRIAINFWLYFLLLSTKL